MFKMSFFKNNGTEVKTCSKGFEQKVATLRLKTLLKIKENSIGNFTTS